MFGLSVKEQRLYEAFRLGTVHNATNAQLATMFEVGERQVKRYLHKLTKLGLIKTTVKKYPVYSGWVNIRRINAIR